MVGIPSCLRVSLRPRNRTRLPVHLKAKECTRAYLLTQGTASRFGHQLAEASPSFQRSLIERVVDRALSPIRMMSPQA